MNGAVSGTGSWYADPPIVARIAGLPVSALTELQFTESFSMLERIASLDEALASDGAVLSDLLYDVIGALGENNKLRPGLVGLRRAVHQVRRPTGGEWNAPISRSLPVELADRLQHWLAQLDERDGSRRELTDVLAAETARKQDALRGVCGRPAFRRALAQASPSLFGELEKWLASPVERPRRRKLARLAKYVCRAAAKTSPFSTFTLIGPGGWTAAQGPPVSFPSFPQVHGVLELDGPYLCLVKAAIASRLRWAESLRVKINSSARPVGTELQFIGRSPGEPLITLQITPAIRECLRLASSGEGISLAELRAALMRSARSDTAAVDRFIGKLTDAGLLDVPLPVADHAADPMGELLSWLKANASTDDAELVDRVAEVGARLRERVAIDDLAAHRRRQIALQQAISGLAAHLRLPPAMATATRYAFHETGVIAGPVATCSIDSWQPALSDLDVVRRWLSIFDIELPIRLALGTYFRERFGSGASVPFHAFYRAVQRERAGDPSGLRSAAASDVRDLLGSSQPWSFRLADRRLARLHVLDDLRADARAAALVPPDGDRVVRADPGSIAKVVADWPDWIATTSAACYVQPRLVAGSVELVLNLVHGGHGRGRSRLRYLIERAGGDAAAVVSSAGHDGSLLAEWGGLLGSTLNVRSASAPYEIDYPFSVSARPTQQRLCFADLVVVHDPSRDLVHLVSESLGRRVTPLHLGMMANFQLPPAARFVDRVFGTAYLAHPVSPPLIPIDSFTLPDNIDYYPRVAIGRVVVQRARWVAAASRIPRIAPGDEDADYLLRLIEWVRVNGLPTRCFVRVGSGGFRGEHPKSRKPVYLDFRNFFSVMDFAQQLEAAEFAVFEEALPDPLDTDRFGADEACVAEFLVELTDGEAGA